MITKNGLILSALLALPLVSRGAVYLEPRLSALHISGTPDIGDVGRVLRSDRPDIVPGIAVGRALSPDVRVELRYTHLGTLTFMKIFPHPTFAPVYPYEYEQKTRLYSLALPVRLIEREGFALRVAPVVHLESTRVALSDLVSLPIVIQDGVLIWPPVVDPNPVKVLTKRHKSDALRAGAELSARYALSPRAALTIHYAYSPLKTFDAHLFGGGLEVKF